MLQLVPTSRPTVSRPPEPPTGSSFREAPSWREALLDLAGSLAGAHALAFAHHDVELLCGLLHRGCAEATLLDNPGACERGAYDLVLFANTERHEPQRIAALARKALVPTGRLVVALHGNQAGRAAIALAGALRGVGFASPRVVHVGAAIVLRAELPAFRLVVSA